jgi:hypothetical protein
MVCLVALSCAALLITLNNLMDQEPNREKAGLLSSDKNFKKLKLNSKTKFKFKAKRPNYG